MWLFETNTITSSQLGYQPRMSNFPLSENYFLIATLPNPGWANEMGVKWQKLDAIRGRYFNKPDSSITCTVFIMKISLCTLQYLLICLWWVLKSHNCNEQQLRQVDDGYSGGIGNPVSFIVAETMLFNVFIHLLWLFTLLTFSCCACVENGVISGLTLVLTLTPLMSILFPLVVSQFFIIIVIHIFSFWLDFIALTFLWTHFFLPWLCIFYLFSFICFTSVYFLVSALHRHHGVCINRKTPQLLKQAIIEVPSFDAVIPAVVRHGVKVRSPYCKLSVFFCTLLFVT